MQSVLRLVTTNGHHTIDRNDEAEAVLREVRLELYKHDYKMLARKIGVSPSTVMSFRSGRTVWPRPYTLFAILEATGFVVRIERRAK